MEGLKYSSYKDVDKTGDNSLSCDFSMLSGQSSFIENQGGFAL